MQEARVHQFFDAYAADFDAIYGTRNKGLNRFVNRLFRKSMRLRFERTLATCAASPTSSVIDIGCGPGHYAIELARRGSERVLGIDFSPAMIELARRNAERAGVAERCEFRVADIFQLGDDETFDFSISMGLMDYIDEPRSLVEHVLTLTRQAAMFSFPLDGGLLAWQRKLRYRRRCELHLYELRQLYGLFRSIEHRDLCIETIARDAFVSVRPPVRLATRSLVA